MSNVRLSAMFAVHGEFRYHGRHLVREESHAIFRKFILNDKYPMREEVYDQIEDREGPLCKAFRKLPGHVRDKWMSTAEKWFKDILEQPLHRRRARILKG